MQDQSRWFEDWALGDTLRSHGRTVTEADMVGFAGLTGDINPLHMDAEYAKTTRYGQRLPHGQLILVLALGLMERVIAPLFHSSVVAFYGIDRLRFLQPVFLGDTIHVERRVAALEGRGPTTGLLTFADEVVRQDGVCAAVFQPKYLMTRRG